MFNDSAPSPPCRHRHNVVISSVVFRAFFANSRRTPEKQPYNRHRISEKTKRQIVHLDDAGRQYIFARTQ